MPSEGVIGQHWTDFTQDGETWWYDGDCPECGHVISTNGTVRVCGEKPDQCDWWELEQEDSHAG